MAILGVQTNRKNPDFTIDDLCFWIPKYSKYFATEEGENTFNHLYPIINGKIFKSVYGTDWEYAMSLAFAHYLTLMASEQNTPVGDTLDSIAEDGIDGVMTSATIGGFSKSIDPSLTYIQDEEATFWNLTSYGAKLMALLKTKPYASMFVVTSYPIGGIK